MVAATEEDDLAGDQNAATRPQPELPVDCISSTAYFDLKGALEDDERKADFSDFESTGIR